MFYTLEQLLDSIAEHGSVTKAAAALGLSTEAISQRFRKLPDKHPCKVDYQIIVTKGGRPRKYDDTPDGERERLKLAQRAFRARQKAEQADQQKASDSEQAPG